MMMKSDHKRSKRKDNDNRLKVVMAVIFLVAVGIMARLFDLQILKYNYYFEYASSQQQVFSKLEPERGKILIQDSKELLGQNPYSAVINKDFAEVYADPEKITNPAEVAEKLYVIFDQANVEKEVEGILSSASSTIFNPLGNEDKAIAEYREIKKQAEIELRKKNIIEEYVKKLSLS